MENTGGRLLRPPVLLIEEGCLGRPQTSCPVTRQISTDVVAAGTPNVLFAVTADTLLADTTGLPSANTSNHLKLSQRDPN